VRVKAVVFDLWDTLIDWDQEANARLNEQLAELVGADFKERWRTSPTKYTGPVRGALADAGVRDEVMEDVCSLRRGYLREALAPRPGAVDTLRTLRERGFKLGMISVCSQDTEELWFESEFAGLFDAEVFSSSFGASKPDPRIYLACCEQLGVEPADAVFVGDGANDELAGAQRVGMEAVLIHRAGEDPVWPDVREWDGLRITSIPQILEVVEPC
jgi:putative hydrolase of the HAD superfamily